MSRASAPSRRSASPSARSVGASSSKSARPAAPRARSAARAAGHSRRAGARPHVGRAQLDPAPRRLAAASRTSSLFSSCTNHRPRRRGRRGRRAVGGARDRPRDGAHERAASRSARDASSTHSMRHRAVVDAHRPAPARRLEVGDRTAACLSALAAARSSIRRSVRSPRAAPPPPARRRAEAGARGGSYAYACRCGRRRPGRRRRRSIRPSPPPAFSASCSSLVATRRARRAARRSPRPESGRHRRGRRERVVERRRRRARHAASASDAAPAGDGVVREPERAEQLGAGESGGRADHAQPRRAAPTRRARATTTRRPPRRPPRGRSDEQLGLSRTSQLASPAPSAGGPRRSATVAGRAPATTATGRHSTARRARGRARRARPRVDALEPHRARSRRIAPHAGSARSGIATLRQPRRSPYAYAVPWNAPPSSATSTIHSSGTSSSVPPRRAARCAAGRHAVLGRRRTRPRARALASDDRGAARARERRHKVEARTLRPTPPRGLRISSTRDGMGISPSHHLVGSKSPGPNLPASVLTQSPKVKEAGRLISGFV